MNLSISPAPCTFAAELTHPNWNADEIFHWYQKTHAPPLSLVGIIADALQRLKIPFTTPTPDLDAEADLARAEALYDQLEAHESTYIYTETLTEGEDDVGTTFRRKYETWVALGRVKVEVEKVGIFSCTYLVSRMVLNSLL